MTNYPVRTTHRPGLTPAALRAKLAAEFGSAVEEGDGARAAFGALESIRVKPVGRDLGVEVVMNPKVPEEQARETIARYNRFLESATGFTAKERAKRMRKSPGGGA